MPEISIIIPTRNCRSALERLLKSIECQTCKDYEVIVVDNYSTDGTGDLAKKYGQVYQLGPERHRQRAFGSSQATGQYFMFFDSDMELDPDLLEECLALGASGCDAVILPERGGGTGFWAECQKLEKMCYWNDPLMEAANRFIRADVYRRVGGYRTDWIAGEDFELHDRLLEAGAVIGRSKSMITHYEETRFWKVVRKKYFYGTQMRQVFRHNPVRSTGRFILFKPAYFRKIKNLLRHPLCTFGLILMKTTQFLAGGIGLLVGDKKTEVRP